MPNMEQTSNQAPNASDKEAGIATWGIPVSRPGFGAGASFSKSGRQFPGKWLGKMTRNLKALKQGWADLPERLAGIFGRASFQNAGGSGLIELLRTNDLVLISRVEAILADSGIAVFLADRHMSALEGSLSFLPRRLLVAADAEARARTILQEAGLGPELRDG
jgi:Putative prokaryotic signal transducing protein